MGVSLTKGGNVSLSKAAPGLTKIALGLGWDARATTGDDFDLDASAFLLNDGSKVPSSSHFVFFNNKKSPDGSVEHLGDNLTGAGAGDDEVINVDLDKVASDVKKVDFTVTIYKADERKQSFGMVSNAYIRVINRDSGEELARYDLGEDYSTETAMVFGEVYRNNEEWKFKAIGQGFAGGLDAMAKNFGVNFG